MTRRNWNYESGSGGRLGPPEPVGRGGAAFNPKIPRLDEDKLVAGVERLPSKEDCAQFVVMALQKGFLDLNQVSSPEQLKEYERSVHDSLGASLILDAIQKAYFLDDGVAPVTVIGTETFTTVARARFRYDEANSISFYDSCFNLSAAAQYQMTLHEGMHLIWNISDDILQRG